MDMSAYLAAPLQLDKICRACLTNKSKMKPLYGACLDEILNSFTSIQVKQDDGLPSLLCEQCILQCNNAYTFKQLCEKSDSVLREFMKPEFQAKLQVFVIPTHAQIDLDQTSNPDSFDESHDAIQDEVEPEYVSCTDSDLKSDVETNEQDDDDQRPNAVQNRGFVAAKPNKCDQCDMSFATRSNLSNHKKKHIREKESLACTVCDKTYTLRSSFLKHMKRHTSNKSRNKLFSCNHCNKQYEDAENLKVHIVRSHADKRPYSCNICNKFFKQSTGLEVHMDKMHADEMPLICRTCGQEFSNLELLTAHRGLHKGEKPFACEGCGRCFSRRESLTIHMRTHTGIKSHFCGVCGKGYNSAISLSWHMKKHGDENTHICDVCGKKYADANGLKYHMKSHLKEKEEQNQQ